MTAKKIAIIGAGVAMLAIAGAAILFMFSPSVFQKGLPVVTSPKPNSEVEGPITVSGKAPGTWFFEAVFPIALEDEDGNEISRSYVEAKSDWMTEDEVPFSGTIISPYGFSGPVSLVLKKDNPSGLPENDARISIPIVVKAPTGATEVTVFFGKYGPDSSMQACTEVFPVKRNIPITRAVATAAITELLKGPTESEKEEGYFTSINENAGLNSLTMDRGAIFVDFNENIERGVGGSCRVTHIREQIIKTLEQFPTVNGIVISVDGRREDILQP